VTPSVVAPGDTKLSDATVYPWNRLILYKDNGVRFKRVLQGIKKLRLSGKQ